MTQYQFNLDHFMSKEARENAMKCAKCPLSQYCTRKTMQICDGYCWADEEAHMTEQDKINYRDMLEELN